LPFRITMVCIGVDNLVVKRKDSHYEPTCRDGQMKQSIPYKTKGWDCFVSMASGYDSQ